MPTHLRRLLSTIVAAGLLTTTPALLDVAAAAPAAPTAARPASAEQPGQYLTDKAHGRRAIDRLGADLNEVAALNKMSARAFKRLLLSDPSIWVSPSGRLLAIDPVPDGIERTAPEPAPFPYNQTFSLHSKPGSSRTIYLDFDGQTISGTEWNNPAVYPAYPSPQSAPAFTLDGDPTTFSNTERDLIQSVWQRVSEDYAPFDVNVTTADPGADALSRTSSADSVFGTRALVSPSDSAASAFCGGRCGGIAYIGVFGIDPTLYGITGTDYYQPAWVFPQLLSYDTKAIAEAVSHEVGHNLGLTHDGDTVSGATYYGGQGSWAPIMGNSYNLPISQWSKGEYANANNGQDDLATITANGLSYVTDDHGNSIAGATSVTAPDRTAPGLISTRGDIDYFAIPQGCAGNVTVSVTPAPTSPNLDVRLRLLSADGTQLAANDPPSGGFSDPATGMSASATVSVTSGSTLYAEVDGVGAGDPVTDGYSDYASLGRFTLSSTGCAVADPAVVAFASATQSVGEAAGTVNLTVTRSGNTTGPATVNYARTGGTATPGDDFTLTNGTLSFAAGETTKNIALTLVNDTADEPNETVQVTLSNPGAGTTLGATTATTLTITDNDEPAPAVVAFASATQSVGEAAGTVNLTVTRSGNTTVPATVNYARTGGTATPGDDFTLTNGTLSFAAGETTKNIALTLVNDTADEPNETVQVTLSNPGAGTTLGATTATTLTITDNDEPAPAVVAFETATTSVDEAAGLIELTVTRTGNAAVPASVSYARTGGSTTVTDVLLDSGTLTFTPGQLSRTIELTVVDDNVTEAAEDVQLALSTPAAGTILGGTSTTVVTIERSDQQPDLLVSTKKARGYIGDDLYNSNGSQQSVSLPAAARGQLRSFFVRVLNDGTDTNLFALRGTKVGKGVTVTYSNNGSDITTWMSGGTAEAELAPDQFALIRIDIKIGRRAAIGSLKTVTITADWIGDSVRTDVVKASVKVKR